MKSLSKRRRNDRIIFKWGLSTRSRNFGLHKMLNISQQLNNCQISAPYKLSTFKNDGHITGKCNLTQEMVLNSEQFWAKSVDGMRELKTAVTSYPDLFHSHFFCVTGNLYAVSVTQARAGPLLWAHLAVSGGSKLQTSGEGTKLTS